ncbi:acyl carrier protein [Reinekea blandensis]|nr:acyl carrier protein [Reinekea blandensis]
MSMDRIRAIVAQTVKLSKDISDISDNDDLYSLGLTSLTTVNLMLSIEDEFDIEFDDNMLSRQTFESITSLAEAIDELQD